MELLGRVLAALGISLVLTLLLLVLYQDDPRAETQMSTATAAMTHTPVATAAVDTPQATVRD